MANDHNDMNQRTQQRIQQAWLRDNYQPDNFAATLDAALSLTNDKQYLLYQFLARKCELIANGTVEAPHQISNRNRRVVKGAEDVEVNETTYLHELLLKSYFEEYGIGGKNIIVPTAQVGSMYERSTRNRDNDTQAIMPSIYGLTENGNDQFLRASQNKIRDNYKLTVKEIFNITFDNEDLLNELKNCNMQMSQHAESLRGREAAILDPDSIEKPRQKVEEDANIFLAKHATDQNLPSSMDLHAKFEKYNNKLEATITNTKQELKSLQKYYNDKVQKTGSYEYMQKLKAIKLATNEINKPIAEDKKGEINQVLHNREILRNCANVLDNPQYGLIKELDNDKTDLKKLAAIVAGFALVSIPVVTLIALPVMMGMAIHSYATKGTFNFFESTDHRAQAIVKDVQKVAINPKNFEAFDEFDLKQGNKNDKGEDKSIVPLSEDHHPRNK